jgi:hypothetical protein
MPPKRSEKTQKSIEQEGRVQLAIQAMKNGRFTSIAAAARSFDVPRTTLSDRMKGVTNQHEKWANGHKFTKVEEETMHDWLLSMDKRGAALTLSMLRDMANLLLKSRGDASSSTTPSVGINWPTQFVKRHPDLTTRFSRRYDYKRALSEDPHIIIEWFKLVQKTVEEYGITSDDVYNFDESGFAMGINATTKVVTQQFFHGRRGVLQAGNREWVTVIETICASGKALPPYIIFRGKVFMKRWFGHLPKNQDWALNTSPNGWTSNDICLDWLEKHFIPHSGASKGKYKLLVLDGHDSHLTPKFDQLCKNNNIVPICMPPHASHLLQPLDVGCFAVLKRFYGTEVAEYVRCGINSIDKEDFLEIFLNVRPRAFKDATIQNSFKATGIVPLNPDRVLEKLNICVGALAIPNRPTSKGSTSSSGSDSQVPRTIKQLAKRKSRTDSDLSSMLDKLSSPQKRTYTAYWDMTQKLLHTSILKDEEIRRLREANKKQTKKREGSKKQIAFQGSLASLEGLEDGFGAEGGGSEIYISGHEAAPEAPVEPDLPSVPTIRRQPTCSGCGKKGHKINQCQERVI